MKKKCFLHLINDIKKGVFVVFNDVDDNKTAEISPLLAELRDILHKMKYCEPTELTKEIEVFLAEE
jgi:hypothetical protein